MQVPIEVLRMHEFCDPESSRYALGGVLMAPGRAVATDGRMLAVLEWSEQPGGPTFIVPHDACKLVRSINKLLRPRKETVEMDDRIICLTGGASIPFELLEGRYPKWVDCIPAGSGPSMTIDARRLAAVCELLVEFFGGDDDDRVPIELTMIGDNLVISAKVEHKDRAACCVIMRMADGRERAEEEPWRPGCWQDPPQPRAETPPANGNGTGAGRRQPVRGL